MDNNSFAFDLFVATFDHPPWAKGVSYAFDISASQTNGGLLSAKSRKFMSPVHGPRRKIKKNRRAKPERYFNLTNLNVMYIALSYVYIY